MSTLSGRKSNQTRLGQVLEKSQAAVSRRQVAALLAEHDVVVDVRDVV